MRFARLTLLTLLLALTAIHCGPAVPQGGGDGTGQPGDGGTGGDNGGTDGGSGNDGTGDDGTDDGSGDGGTTDPIDPAAATAIDKIDEALEAGDIDDVTALRYRVFSVFGDERLPQDLRGEIYEEGTDIITDLAQRYGDLPEDVKQEMTPFILPPDAPGSWYQQNIAAQSKLTPQMQQPAGNFNTYDVTDGSGASVAAVKWPTSSAGLEPSASVIRDALSGANGVWEKLVGLMGRTPPSDSSLDDEYSGGDGRFDVYLLPQGGNAFGYTQPHSAGFFQSVFNDRTRSCFIVVDTSTIASRFSGAAYDIKLRSNIAHEFMHAIQFAYDLAGPRSEYWWLGDATATWAEHFCFPSENKEQEDAPSYLKTLDVPLELDLGNRRYGGYLYFFQHASRFGDDIVRFTYESAELVDTLEAINRAVPNGIAENWDEFAVSNWNDGPVNDYEQDDGLQRGAADETTTEIPLPSGNQDEVELDIGAGGMLPLTAKYYHFDFASSQARTVMFANGFTFKLDRGIPPLFQGALGDETLYATRLSSDERNRLHVRALVKQNGQWIDQAYDLTDVAFASFCQEASSESVEELVIILANARWEDDERDPVTYSGEPARLFVSNVGCGAWEGTATYNESSNNGGDTLNAEANFQTIAFTRETVSIEQIMAGASQMDFGFGGAEIVPTGVLPGAGLFGGGYELSDAMASWTHSATYNDGRCTESGSGTIQLADQIAGTLTVSPTLIGSAGNELPSLYRSFFIESIFVDADEDISVRCVQPDGSVTTSETVFGAALGGGYTNSEFGNLTIGSSGNRINQSWTVDDITIDLDLTSQMIP